MSAAHGSLRVGMIGHAFMGAAHSYGWRNAARVFELPVEPEMAVIAGSDAARSAAAAARLGWAQSVADWRELIERPDVDIVDICAPGDLHFPIAIAALEAGKHVLCEKPLANTADEADEMARVAEAAARRGVFAMCGFTYRRQPAVALARRTIAEGRLGQIRHIRVQYLQDWLSDPDSPYTWRLDATRSGSGALGDLGAHAVDLAQWLTASRITTLSARTQRFVPTRPLPDGSGRGEVTVDDAAFALAEFDSGLIGTFEVTRYALGRKNAFRVEIDGTLGSLAWDFERNNELNLYTEDAGELAGFATVLATRPGHPYLADWWPDGHGLGFDAGFVNQAADFIRAIAAGRQPEPSFADAAQVQRVLDAVEASQASRGWEAVSPEKEKVR
jgi:predicted dehydrogenase